MNRSQVKWLLVSIGFSVLVLGVVLYFTVDDTTVDYIRRINVLPPRRGRPPPPSPLSSGRCGSRRCRVARVSGAVYTLHEPGPANMFVAAVTPSQAGGEPVRIHEFYRAGRPGGDATAVVIMWNASSTGSSSAPLVSSRFSFSENTGAASPRGSAVWVS